MPDVGSASTGQSVAAGERGDDVGRHAAAAAGEDHAPLAVEPGQLGAGHAETQRWRTGLAGRRTAPAAAPRACRRAARGTGG